jgi:glycosyltransferase involved in cell wall biosynthesis
MITTESRNWSDVQSAAPTPATLRAQPLLTIVVPVYNEVGTIDELLRRVLAAAAPVWPGDWSALKDTPASMQVIVVNDGSTDGTTEKLEAWTGRVTVFTHVVNRGKGAAIRTGLTVSHGRFTIIQDADLEYDPRDYERLLEPLLAGETDAVYGSRYSASRSSRTEGNESNEVATSISRGGMATLPMLPSRPSVQSNRRSICRLGVSLLNLLVRCLYGVRISDEATCYKVFRTADLRAMDLQCERFEFCPEVTAKACRMGLSIREVPISYNARSAMEGKKIRWRDGWTAVKTLWRWRKWQAGRFDQ